MTDSPIPEGMMRYVPAPEHATGGVTPIAIEKMEAGKWERLGYACGFGVNVQAVSLEEWLSAATPD